MTRFITKGILVDKSTGTDFSFQLPVTRERPHLAQSRHNQVSAAMKVPLFGLWGPAEIEQRT